MNTSNVAGVKSDTLIAERKGNTRTLLGIALFVTLVILLMMLVEQVFPHFSDTEGEVSPSFAFLRESLLLGVVMLATSVVSVVERRNPLAFGLIGTKRLQFFWQGAASGFVLLSLLIGYLIFSHGLVIDQRVLGSLDALKYGTAWLGCCFIVAIAEETLFRGYLQTALTRLVGFWPAAAILSLLFGLVHLRNRGEVLMGIIVVVLSGAVFCFGLLRTGSLWWGIGFHTAWDWSQSFLYGTPDSGIVIAGRLVESHPMGNAFLSGGAAGPEGSTFLIPIMVLALIGIHFTVNRAG
ncbi:MAG TPA: CPBP family intramembrane glutamic endopeptidase [Steroidobacteraceae bacterium]